MTIAKFKSLRGITEDGIVRPQKKDVFINKPNTSDDFAFLETNYKRDFVD